MGWEEGVSPEGKLEIHIVRAFGTLTAVKVCILFSDITHPICPQARHFALLRSESGAEVAVKAWGD